ncbi:ribosomal RNA processing protein 1 homolog B isoform X1 [Pogona vitticeps]
MAPAAAAALPPEIQFAQRLAANEKRIRDRALKKLRSYITLRTQSPAGSFSPEEFLKIWKGLFYCMWMQDKPLLQEELSNNISQLMHVIENMDTRNLFIQTFWQTMNREWTGIDRLRLDKYYMLIRMMLRQSFEVLRRNGWNESFTQPFLNMLTKEVMHPDSNAAVGVKLHFIDIYLEELAKVGAKELTADQNLKFIEPFCKIAAKTKDHLFLQAISRGIFETIVDQSPFAIEDLMKELEAGSDDDISEDECNDEENKLIAKDRDLSNKLSPSSEAQGSRLEGADDNIGPVLQFDYKNIADTLFELASRKNTPASNRKRLYKVVKRFQDLSEGTFPQDDFPEDVSTDEDDDTLSRKKWKRKSGKPLDQSRLEKEENARNRKNGMEEEEEEELNPRPQKKRKRRKRKASQIADTCAVATSTENGAVSLNEFKEPVQDHEAPSSKKRGKKSLILEASQVPTTTGGLTDTSTPKGVVMKQPKKENGSPENVCIETVHQNGQANINTEDNPGDCDTVFCDSKVIKKKRKLEARVITGNVFSEEEVKKPKKDRFAESKSIVYQRVKLKKKKLGTLMKIRCTKQKLISLKKKRKIKEVLNSTLGNELKVENKESKTKETGGPAIQQKKKKANAGNDFVKFEKIALPKPVFFRKAKGGITSMQLNKLQSSDSKKVTFGLSKNMTAEFKKTDKSILVSPEGPSRVAFNPKQKPLHGVLKSSSTDAPQMKKPLLVPVKKRPTAVDFF